MKLSVRFWNVIMASGASVLGAALAMPGQAAVQQQHRTESVFH